MCSHSRQPGEAAAGGGTDGPAAPKGSQSYVVSQLMEYIIEESESHQEGLSLPRRQDASRT